MPTSRQTPMSWADRSEPPTLSPAQKARGTELQPLLGKRCLPWCKEVTSCLSPRGAGNSCRCLAQAAASGVGSTCLLSLQNELLHRFIFILLEAYLPQTLELLPWILQNLLGMLWAQLPWADVLMAKPPECTDPKHCAAEPLLNPGALAMHWDREWWPARSSSLAAAEQLRWEPSRCISNTGTAPCQPQGLAGCSPKLSCSQPGDSNAAFRHLHKSSLDISITHEVLQ